MKQKNLVLLGIALGCGLVAAIVVAKLGAGGRSDVEMVQVLVARKDLPIGTPLIQEKFEEYLAFARFPKANLPPDIVNDTELLKGKTLTRTLKMGNYFAATDLSAGMGITIPEGHNLFSLRMDQASAAVFTNPGSRVDVMFLEHLANNKKRAGVLFRDVLVIGVNTADRRPEGQGAALPQIESVSLAVKPRQASMLMLAESRGQLKLLLRGSTNKDVAREAGNASDLDIVDGLPFDKQDAKADPNPTPVVTTEKILFAKSDVPAHEKLTEENLAKWFELRETPVVAVPTRALRDLNALKGKYVLKALDADLPVLSTALGEEQVRVEPKDPPRVDPDPKMVETPKEQPKEQPKRIVLRVFEQTIVEAGQARRIRFAELPNGSFRRLENEAELEKLERDLQQQQQQNLSAPMPLPDPLPEPRVTN
jgi:Flp pilus assembly protein CpaB